MQDQGAARKRYGVIATKSFFNSKSFTTETQRGSAATNESTLNPPSPRGRRSLRGMRGVALAKIRLIENHAPHPSRAAMSPDHACPLPPGEGGTSQWFARE
jgi:hypothetical protein